MGEDCLLPFIETAVENNCGLFILLETSNSGAQMILKSKLETGDQLNEKIADFIQRIHVNMNLNDNEIGPLGCVIGATNSNIGHWRKKLPNSLFLMPGIGAQGGNMDSVKTVMLPNGNGVWIPISRGITHAPESSISRLEYKTLVESNAKKYNYAFKSLI